MNINIPSPCQQDWNNMQTSEHGRFCEHCQENVVDFTTMSDEAIIQFLKINPFTPCARFNARQLNRPLSPISKLTTRVRFVKAKIAAIILTLLSPKIVFSQDKNASKNLYAQSNAPVIKNDTTIIISGNVKNGDHLPYPNVPVFFDNHLIATTDEQGYFAFAPIIETGQHLIVFKAMETRFETRSYHSNMGNVHYNIIIDTAVKSYSMGGVPLIPFVNTIYANCSFKRGSIRMSADSITDIHNLASAMRSNPNTHIKITLSYTDDRTKKLSLRRYAILIKKFVDEQGVDQERFLVDLKKVDTMDDHISFSSAYQY